MTAILLSDKTFIWCQTITRFRPLHDIRLVLDNRSICCSQNTGMTFSITET
jgi:hypothetical protein